MPAIRTLIYIVLLSIFLHPAIVSAQEDDNLDQYFNDGGLSTRKNLISTNFLSPVWGTWGLRYERALGDILSLEVAAQRTNIYQGLNMLDPWALITPGTYEMKPGIAFSAASHFFLSETAPRGHYMGLRYNWRRVHTIQPKQTILIQAFTVDYGYNLALSKYLFFCSNSGFGLSYNQYHTFPHPTSNRNPKFSIYLDFLIGLGIHF